MELWGKKERRRIGGSNAEKKETAAEKKKREEEEMLLSKRKCYWCGRWKWLQWVDHGWLAAIGEVLCYQCYHYHLCYAWGPPDPSARQRLVRDILSRRFPCPIAKQIAEYVYEWHVPWRLSLGRREVVLKSYSDDEDWSAMSLE